MAGWSAIGQFLKSKVLFTVFQFSAVFFLILILSLIFPSNAFCSWTAPIGMPEPPFGITTTHTMYAEAGRTYDYGDDSLGPVPYRTGACGPYTHYIDSVNPNATDTNNPHGTESKPRVTRPSLSSMPAGTIVYIHSGTHGGPGSTTGFGTSDDPIFIRGNPENKPVWTGVFDLDLDHVILENFKFDLQTYARNTIRIGKNYQGARTHIAIRNCEFYNGMYDPNQSYQVIRIVHPWDNSDTVQNIVIYNNYFHNIGDGRTTPTKSDAVGVSVDINAQKVWILDNTFHKIGGDSIQVASDSAGYVSHYMLPNHIYIGRNTSSDNYENFLDLKTCEDVIVSQNVAYNFGEGYGTFSTGASAFRYGSQDINSGDQRNNVWTIFNLVYNNAGSDGAFLLYNGETEQYSDEMYFIGNIVHDCHNSFGNATAFGSWNAKKVYWAQNVAYNCDRGGVFFGDRFGTALDENFYFVNNILGEMHPGSATNSWLSFGAIQASLDRSVIRNNIFYESSGLGKIRWGTYLPTGRINWEDHTYTQFASYRPDKITGSMQENPRHVDATNGDFRLASGSLGIDAGIEHEYFDRFYNRYGINTRVDFENKAIPLGGIDIGAYEYQGASDIISPGKPGGLVAR